ncbi:hypothetical protein [Streptosporangium sp. NPDC051022]|uniref:hypothetical protein n=1 Tax=Streptosporangium sp. NPDC051022 TaxID=3155752 RepID=UPI003438F6F9
MPVMSAGVLMISVAPAPAGRKERTSPADSEDGVKTTTVMVIISTAAPFDVGDRIEDVSLHCFAKMRRCFAKG